MEHINVVVVDAGYWYVLNKLVIGLAWVNKVSCVLRCSLGFNWVAVKVSSGLASNEIALIIHEMELA